MPALFLGHGSPMNALEDNEFRRRLYAVRYPAPGHPRLARRTADLLGAEAGLDGERGLDHGCWSVLRAMYPEADVPVVQLSLDASRSAAMHYELALGLRPLRDDGVLILGSGNVVHNLRLADFGREDGEGWAVGFDTEVRRRVLRRDHAGLVAYPTLTPEARRPAPPPQHKLAHQEVHPQQADDEEAVVFNDRVVMASISMTCYQVGPAAPGSRWNDSNRSGASTKGNNHLDRGSLHPRPLPGQGPVGSERRISFSRP
jgi:4,5-DOPA dioxygenase extradiol